VSKRLESFPNASKIVPGALEVTGTGKHGSVFLALQIANMRPRKQKVGYRSFTLTPVSGSISLIRTRSHLTTYVHCRRIISDPVTVWRDVANLLSMRSGCTRLVQIWVPR